ncbi:MAG: bifunctional folylpolyglutamate synthase/dihydrofolate synthase, partial [Oscillospiraceae bacterium]|nr:bifunctional folylpolyglutamate synthase/dihydrofolate synthase [Oscillospiraceae bacterium]
RGYAISGADIKTGLENVLWQGRFELLRRDPTFILDGAHNPHGIHAAAESFRALFGERKLIFLVGVMADKDVAAMMAEIVPFAARFVAVKPRNPRAMDAERLAGFLRDLGAEAESAPSVEAGVLRAAELAKFAGTDGVAVALGSLYFSGDVRAAVSALPTL